ncbi:hypothetical protein [Streptomyces sp. NPDC050485]|uniref:hypothetical protein n=1 Tax=Streptomyces sp. NPDC050485 TaxID=3365617 RepID=UPI0037AE5B9F
MHRAVREDLRQGRVLNSALAAPTSRDANCYDRALAELALPGTVDETARAEAQAVAVDKNGQERDAAPGTGPTPFASGVRLYVPGAHVVATRQLATVTEALAHTVAARGIACVYGDLARARPSRCIRRCACSRTVCRSTVRR